MADTREDWHDGVEMKTAVGEVTELSLVLWQTDGTFVLHADKSLNSPTVIDGDWIKEVSAEGDAVVVSLTDGRSLSITPEPYSSYADSTDAALVLAAEIMSEYELGR